MEKDESILDTFKTIIYAIVIAILIRTFLFEPFKIPSGSMYPTLYVGDFLFVSKYTYGYSKHSLPFSLPLIKGRVWADEPQRGDVVVFKFPQDNKTDFIKRIVGLPGDKIKMENGRLYINGKMVEREKIEDFVNRDDKGNAERYRQYIETLPGGVKHHILELSDREPSDNMVEVTVPQGNYLLWATTVTALTTAVSTSVLSPSRTWSAKPASSFSRTTPTMPGTNPGPGRKKSVSPECSTK